MVVVPKTNGKVIYVDLTKLNASMKKDIPYQPLSRCLQQVLRAWPFEGLRWTEGRFSV